MGLKKIFFRFIKNQKLEKLSVGFQRGNWSKTLPIYKTFVSVFTKLH